MTDQPEATYTIEQLAEYWQCNTHSVRRAIARGDLKAFRIGRLIRIRAEDARRAERPVTSTDLSDEN